MESSILEQYKKHLEKRAKNAPSHEKAASVNEILKVVPETKTYNYTYWLRKVGTASYSQVLAICKAARELEKKYSKGGYITNQLKPYETKSGKVKGN